MGEHVDRLAVLAGGDVLDQLQAVAADRLVDGDILVGDLRRAAIGRRDPRLARLVADGGDDLVERPFQIDRGRPRGEQRRDRRAPDSRPRYRRGARGTAP